MRRALRVLLAVSVVLVARPAPAAAAEPGRVEIRVEGDAVELGRAFPLTVVRQWDAGLVAEDFDERSLGPLVVRLDDVSQRREGAIIEETRRFDAYAFATDEVTIPGQSFLARDPAGGSEQVVRGEGLTLRVVPALAADSPPAPELPGEPIHPRRPWGTLLGVLALALAAGALLARRLRARPAALEPEPDLPPPPDPSAVALIGLDALSAREPADAATLRAWYADGAALLRVYVRALHGFGAPEQTTEEIVAALRASPSVPTALRTGIAALLARCDAVKFAARAPDVAARVAFVADARALVIGSAGAAP